MTTRKTTNKARAGDGRSAAATREKPRRLPRPSTTALGDLFRFSASASVTAGDRRSAKTARDDEKSRFGFRRSLPSTPMTAHERHRPEADQRSSTTTSSLTSSLASSQASVNQGGGGSAQRRRWRGNRRDDDGTSSRNFAPLDASLVAVGDSDAQNERNRELNGSEPDEGACDNCAAAAASRRRSVGSEQRRTAKRESETRPRRARSAPFAVNRRRSSPTFDASSAPPATKINRATVDDVTSGCLLRTLNAEVGIPDGNSDRDGATVALAETTSADSASERDMQLADALAKGEDIVTMTSCDQAWNCTSPEQRCASVSEDRDHRNSSTCSLVSDNAVDYDVNGVMKSSGVDDVTIPKSKFKRRGDKISAWEMRKSYGNGAGGYNKWNPPKAIVPGGQMKVGGPGRLLHDQDQSSEASEEPENDDSIRLPEDRSFVDQSLVELTKSNSGHQLAPAQATAPSSKLWSCNRSFFLRMTEIRRKQHKQAWENNMSASQFERSFYIQRDCVMREMADEIQEARKIIRLQESEIERLEKELSQVRAQSAEHEFARVECEVHNKNIENECRLLKAVVKKLQSARGLLRDDDEMPTTYDDVIKVGDAAPPVPPVSALKTCSDFDDEYDEEVRFSLSPSCDDAQQPSAAAADRDYFSAKHHVDSDRVGGDSEDVLTATREVACQTGAELIKALIDMIESTSTTTTSPSEASSALAIGGGGLFSRRGSVSSSVVNVAEAWTSLESQVSDACEVFMVSERASLVRNAIAVVAILAAIVVDGDSDNLVGAQARKLARTALVPAVRHALAETRWRCAADWWSNCW